jgi:hypothetical protein
VLPRDVPAECFVGRKVKPALSTLVDSWLLVPIFVFFTVSWRPYLLMNRREQIVDFAIVGHVGSSRSFSVGVSNLIAQS